MAVSLSVERFQGLKGKAVDFIKNFRGITGCSLREAKQVYDALMEGWEEDANYYLSASAEPTVTIYFEDDTQALRFMDYCKNDKDSELYLNSFSYEGDRVRPEQFVFK